MKALRYFLIFSVLLYITTAFALTAGQRGSLFSGIKPVFSENFLGESSVPSGNFTSNLTYSGVSLSTMTDATGALTYKPNNLLLQSNTFASPWLYLQTGTGVTPVVTPNFAIAPDGTSTAARIQLNLGATPSTSLSRMFQGVGANLNSGMNDVWLKTNDGSSLNIYFTSSSGISVLKTITGAWQQVFSKGAAVISSQIQFGLSGSGSSIGLSTAVSADLLAWMVGQSAVTYETTPRPGDQVITTSAAYYGPRFDYSPSSVGTPLGLLVEAAATNVVLQDRHLATTWVSTNVTAANTQTGIDGVANSASSLTATAGNGTTCQAITLGSSARFESAYVKRITGTGVVNLSMDNGATYTPITIPVAFGRVSIPTQTLANPEPCFQITTNGDAIAVDVVQNETGSSGATSAILTTTTSVTRAADSVTKAGALASAAAAGVLRWKRTNEFTKVTACQAYAAGASPSTFDTGYWYQNVSVYSPGVTLAKVNALPC